MDAADAQDRDGSAQISLVGDRDENQDRLGVLVAGERRLLIVADGMGGHADGATAAQCVLDHAAEQFPTFDGKQPLKLLQEIAVAAHQAISELRPDLADRLQPRTTVVMCFVDGTRAIFAHAGDSRGYLLRDNKVLLRTRDHSAVEMLVRHGKLNAADARSHPLRNQVARCLGGGGHPPPLEFSPCPPLRDGDSLLLCSDGFWEPLTDDELPTRAPQEPLPALAKLAVSRHPGFADNCTAVRLNFKSV